MTIQSEFAGATLALLKEHGIHTAIETNLATPWARIAPLLPLLDLVMFDIKSMDTARHRERTGIGNEMILENAERLAREAIPLIVRTPLIPGFNDTSADIEAIARCVRDYPNLEYYELLAFNPLGADKYKCMGKEYRMQDAPMIPAARLQEFKAAAESSGITVRIA